MLISYLYYYSQNKSVYFRKNNYLNTIDRVSNRQTTWYLINIKARRKQTTEHYVQVFRSLYEQDPLVGFPRGGKLGSLKYVTFSNLLDENGNCRSGYFYCSRNGCSNIDRIYLCWFIIGDKFASIKKTEEGRQFIQDLNSSFAACLFVSTISIIAMIIISSIY